MRRVVAIVLVDLCLLALLFAAGEIAVRCHRERGIGAGLASFTRHAPQASDAGGAADVLPDPLLGHRLNPERPDVNALGFRGGEVESPKPAGVFRILVLGDSVSWLRHGYVGILGAELGRRPGTRIEVLNASVPAYTSWQERHFLARIVGPVEPDLVLLQHCLNDNHRYLHILTEDGKQLLTHEARRTLLPEGDGPFARFCRWSYLAFEIRRRVAGLAGGARRYHPWEGQVDFGAAWIDSTWAEATENIRAMRDLARDHGARFLLMSVPFEPQLDPDRLARDRESTLKPQRKLAALCAAEGIPFLDLEPAIEAAAGEDGKGFFHDGVHFSEAGHALAARELLARLERESLLP